MASERLDRLVSSEGFGSDDRRLRMLVDGTTAYAIFTLDPDGTVASWNAGAEHIEGYSAAEIVGKHFSVLYPQNAVSDGRPEQALASASADGCHEEEGWHMRRDGTVFRANVVVNALRGHCGELIGFGVFTRDITARKELEAQLAYQAFHDPLTGLPNRNLLRDHLRLAVARAQRSKLYLAVLFIDLDHFKEINDLMGHRVGDEVLIDVAHRIRRVLRDSDTAARLGGDEFVIVCEGLASPDEASVVAQRVGRALAIVVRRHPRRMTVTASIGIATGNVDHDLDRLLAEADAAMYAAKRRRRHRYEMADLTPMVLAAPARD
jgi:diguanylate cyclase (GGDEF)-like protein/PAS domain S-box-containing protein